MLKFGEISVLQVVTFKKTIYSPLVNFVVHETNNISCFWKKKKKSITSNVCKVHVLLGRIYGINLKQS